MVRYRLIAIICVLGTLALAWPATAAVPQVVSYQGRLLNSDSTPFDGPVLIKFTIYDRVGADLWNSGFQTVDVENGLFEILLGAPPQPPLPHDLFTDSTRELGITVDTDPEIIPRTRLVSASYAYHALRADTAGLAQDAGNLGSQPPAYYLDWGNITEMPACFADGTDDDGPGDIEEVAAGSGLSGGGTSGSVTLDVATDGITSAHIMDGQIVDADISGSADINAQKISGTAAVLSQENHFTSSNYFDPPASVRIGDSTFRADNTGITIGDGQQPTDDVLVSISRRRHSASYTVHRTTVVNTGTGSTHGHRIYNGYSEAQGDGSLYGVRATVGNTGGGNGNAYGLYADVDNNVASGLSRYGLRIYSGSTGNTGGWSYGVRAATYGGAGSAVYGIYSSALGSAATEYAGYFSGDVHVSGTLSKTGGTFKIDHPLDPERKYLQHSFVESPDMMNIYNGNVTLNASGEATVILPDYFETLNMDFRYQLTAIGAPGPSLYVASKIDGNQFRIAGGEAFGEVSWQVTGIRNDKWAQAHRIEVEVDKPAPEIGTYLHPKEHGQPIEMHINYEQIQEDLERAEGKGAAD